MSSPVSRSRGTKNPEAKVRVKREKLESTSVNSSNEVVVAKSSRKRIKSEPQDDKSSVKRLKSEKLIKEEVAEDSFLYDPYATSEASGISCDLDRVKQEPSSDTEFAPLNLLESSSGFSSGFKVDIDIVVEDTEPISRVSELPQAVILSETNACIQEETVDPERERKRRKRKYPKTSLIQFSSTREQIVYTVRSHCWKLLTETLDRRIRLPADVKESDLDDPYDVALRIESCIFKLFSFSRLVLYKNRIITRLNGLKRAEVRFKLLSGFITPEEFARMSPREFLPQSVGLQEYLLANHLTTDSVRCVRCKSHQVVAITPKRDYEDDGRLVNQKCENCGNEWRVS